MLNSREMTMIEICAEYVATDKGGIAGLAERMGVGDWTIKAAITWGRKQGLIGGNFRIGSAGSMQMNLCVLKKMVEKLERRLDADLRGENEIKEVGGQPVKIRKKTSAMAIASIAKQVLDYRTRILELEGLYKTSIDIKLKGRMDHSGNAALLSDDDYAAAEAILKKAGKLGG